MPRAIADIRSVVVLVAALSVATAACGGSAAVLSDASAETPTSAVSPQSLEPVAEKHFVTGTLDLPAAPVMIGVYGHPRSFQPECVVDPRLGSVLEERVTVSDGSGAIVGLADVELDTSKYVNGFDPIRGVCMERFEVMVNDADFYVFQVGSRTGPSYRRDELEQQGWVVALQLPNSP